MRDKVKDMKYYEEYLLSCNKRIARFENQLETLDMENILGKKACNSFIAALYRDKIIAMYSCGYNPDEIRQEYISYIKHFVVSVDETTGYYCVIDAIALAVLFNYNDIDMLKMILDKSKMHDILTDTLVNWLDSDFPISNINLCCTWFIKFKEVAPSERAEFLKEYLEKAWYFSHKDADWYNSHKHKTNIYVGYWSFEVGAVAKIFGVRGDKAWTYYPFDLVVAQYKAD